MLQAPLPIVSKSDFAISAHFAKTIWSMIVDFLFKLADPRDD